MCDPRASAAEPLNTPQGRVRAGPHVTARWNDWSVTAPMPLFVSTNTPRAWRCPLAVKTSAALAFVPPAVEPVVAVYAQPVTLRLNETSYFPVPRCFVPVTPAPRASDP